MYEYWFIILFCFVLQPSSTCFLKLLIHHIIFSSTINADAGWLNSSTQDISDKW